MTTFQLWWVDGAGIDVPDFATEADRIAFEPGFVVFRNNDLRILRTVRADRVANLVQLPEPCPAKGPDGYECTFRHEGGPHSFETRCDQKYMPYVSHGQAVPIQCTKMMHRPWIAHSWIVELSPTERTEYEARLVAERERASA